MDDITRAMINTDVPTVVYVYPSGSRAASAGVFITYAATIAAMAPTTHLGAAHPVTAGGGSPGGEDKTLMTKITNDSVAGIRGLAIRRGRNAAWAEKAVRESVSITETEALALHVIDLVAVSPGDLLAKIDGRVVQTPSGKRQLHTRNARPVEIPMDLTEQFLALLSDPNVGFILMTMAIYGIIFELSNPGSVFPGVIGGLALILALRRKVQTGREGLIGAVGVARTQLSPEGTVFVQGEIWSAESLDGVIPAGARVRVARVEGLRLQVNREEASAS